MHTLKRRTLLGSAALWATLVALPAGATGKPAQGLTDTSIKLGVSGPLTGPVAAVGAVAEGLKLKVAAVNAAGGVRMRDGRTRTIELVVQDDGFDPQRTLTNVRRLEERSGVFALVGVVGTPNNEAIARYLDQRGLPNLFMYSGVHELSAGRSWTVGLVPSFAVEAATFVAWLKENRPEAKVGLLYLNTESGQSFRAALVKVAEGSKITLVAEQPVTSTDPTVDTQMTNLRTSGADTLVVIASPRQSAQAVRIATESGWKPTTMVSYIGASETSLRPIGVANARGILTSQFMQQAGAATPSPGLRAYLDTHAAARPPFEKGDANGMLGYLTGEALVHVLETMAEPTRKSMIEAAQNLDNVSLGLLLPGITLTTRAGRDIYPIESLQVFRFDGQHYEPAGQVTAFEGGTSKF
ncbi:MAG: ABC transporter substrate-binding protein [Methylobacterium frigidaeris]